MHARLSHDPVARLHAWRHGTHAAVCDLIEPWTHGTVVRATRYPSYFDYNVVRVEDDPPLSVEELGALADQALAGLSHRRVDFDLIEPADRLRAGFEAADWRATRLVWMSHDEPPPPVPSLSVEVVPYDAVRDLRVAWHQEDFDGLETDGYLAQSREVHHRRDVQVLAALAGGRPIAFAQIECEGETAEITQVYVHPEHRGRGHGTAMTRRAIELGADAGDLWICADDEDRPKELYQRLGFRPVARTMEFQMVVPV